MNEKYLEIIKRVDTDFFTRINTDKYPPHYIFNQTWPNTATGLAEEGDFSGQAFTDALTVVIEYNKKYYVYFNGKPAYIVEEPINPEFFEDLKNHRLVEKLEAFKKY